MFSVRLTTLLLVQNYFYCLKGPLLLQRAPCSSVPVLGVYTECVCACVAALSLITQVHIGGLWSLRVRCALVHSVQQLLLHLCNCVTVQALHRHLGSVLILRVHTVQRLQRQRSEGTRHIYTGKSAPTGSVNY